MPFATYKYLIDIENDGSYAADITPFVLSFSCSRGRDYASQLSGRSSAGSCTIRVLNTDYRFSPLYDGPYAGKLKPGRKIRARMYTPTGGWANLWTGYLDTVMPQSGVTKGEATATITGYGCLARTANRKVEIEMQAGVTTDVAAGIVLDEIGWPDTWEYRTIDTNARTTMNRFWTGDEYALTVLHNIEETEAGFLNEGPSGQITFQGRGYRLGLSSQVTYTNAAGGTIRYATIQPEDSSRDVFNIFKAEVHTFDKSDSIVLWMFTGSPAQLTSSQSIRITAKFPPKGMSGNYVAVDTWETFTPRFTQNDDGSGSDYTSQLSFSTITKRDTSATLTITNNGPNTGYLTFMEWDGIAVVEGDVVEVSKEYDPQKLEVGEKTYTFQGRYIQSLNEANGFVEHYGEIYKDPVTVVVLSLVANASSAHLQEAKSRDLSDKITIFADDEAIGLGIDEDFYVERIEHQIEGNGLHVMRLMCSAVTDHNWSVAGDPYTAKIKPSSEDQTSRVPDDLQPVGFDPGGRVDVGIVAWKYNEDITQGEIRAKFYVGGAPDYVDLRTVAEGGTFVGGTSTEKIITGAASHAGMTTSFVSASYGRWYYAGRLKNVSGWSVWSDGNDFPSKVKDYVAIESGVSSDGGPPNDSIVSLEMVGNGVVPHATRPAINGNTLLFGFVQVKNGNVGDWYDLDANTGPAETYYDGSGADHVYDKATGRITAPGPITGVGSAGGMVMVDVRNNSTFHHDWCQWGGIKASDITGNSFPASGFRMNTLPDSGQQWQHVRIKIVKWPSQWTGYGYYGDTPGAGISEAPEFWKENGDKTTKEFVFPLIPLDDATPMANIIGRVFFENKLCRAECGRNDQTPLEDTGSPAGASGLQIITHTQDASIPVGMMKLTWYRDTLNYQSIYTAGFWLSNDLPAQGPFSMERAAHGAYTYETGMGAVVVAEDTHVAVTRGATVIPEHAILVIYTNDPNPDNDMDAEYVDSADGTGFTMHTPFHKSGTYSYAVIKRWMDTGTSESENLKYIQFKVPDEIGGDREAIRWTTGTVPMPAGVFYVTGCSRNSMGVGTRMTCSSLNPGGLGCIPLSIIMGTPPIVYTEIGENSTFFIDAVVSFKLMTPTGNIYCGKPIVYLIRQPLTGGPTDISEFDTKFRFGDEISAVTLSATPGALDYLGFIYFALEDRFDCVACVHGYVG